jgi:hypothetical protein
MFLLLKSPTDLGALFFRINSPKLLSKYLFRSNIFFAKKRIFFGKSTYLGRNHLLTIFGLFCFCPERPVTLALARHHNWKGKKRCPAIWRIDNYTKMKMWPSRLIWSVAAAEKKQNPGCAPRFLRLNLTLPSIFFDVSKLHPGANPSTATFKTKHWRCST